MFLGCISFFVVNGLLLPSGVFFIPVLCLGSFCSLSILQSLQLIASLVCL